MSCQMKAEFLVNKTAIRGTMHRALTMVTLEIDDIRAITGHQEVYLNV